MKAFRYDLWLFTLKNLEYSKVPIDFKLFDLLYIILIFLSALQTKNQGSTFLTNLKRLLFLPSHEVPTAGTCYNIPLMNSLVLYVGMQVISHKFVEDFFITTVYVGKGLTKLLFTDCMQCFPIMTNYYFLCSFFSYNACTAWQMFLILWNSKWTLQAIQQLQSNSSTSVPHTGPMDIFLVSAAMDIFNSLIVDLDLEGRYTFLNAVANQLRYPNNHTHYFSFVLLYFFVEAKQVIFSFLFIVPSLDHSIL